MLESLESTATLSDIALKLDFIYALLLFFFVLLVVAGVVYILYRFIDGFISF